jgi:hypothetical protein
MMYVKVLAESVIFHLSMTGFFFHHVAPSRNGISLFVWIEKRDSKRWIPCEKRKKHWRWQSAHSGQSSMVEETKAPR